MDVTLDLVGGPYLGASIRAVGAQGAHHAHRHDCGPIARPCPVGMILGKRLTLRGTVLRARTIEEKRAVTAAFARDVVPLLGAGALRPASIASSRSTRSARHTSGWRAMSRSGKWSQDLVCGFHGRHAEAADTEERTPLSSRRRDVTIVTLVA